MGNKKQSKKTFDVNAANRILHDGSSFSTVETFKAIRTNVMFSMPKTENGKVIVVASAAPGEGKSTTTINLAITFAQIGAKVVIVDCDLRKPRIHRYLELERKSGLSNVLCGYAELESVIKHNIREDWKMDVITAGETPPNPAELLESEEFGKIIDKLRKSYDYIFIDTPPVTVVTDAVVVMKHSVGVVLVVKQNYTTFDALDATVNLLRSSDVKILGSVLLGVDEKSKRYSYYRKGKYGYKYGYGYGREYKYEDTNDEDV